jgi:hypothetical protein
MTIDYDDLSEREGTGMEKIVLNLPTLFLIIPTGGANFFATFNPLPGASGSRCGKLVGRLREIRRRHCAADLVLSAVNEFETMQHYQRRFL